MTDGPVCISECSNCDAMYWDKAETCSVCPHCGHENEYTDE